MALTTMALSTLVIALIILTNTVSSNKTNETSTKTIGGTEVLERKYPFMVSVQLFSDTVWVHLCGGVICSDNRIIAPAQCIDGHESWQLRVLVGSNKLNETEREYYTGKTYFVSRYVMHEYYDEETMANDISILHIFGHLDLDFSTHPPTQSLLRISLTDTVPGTKCTVLGWAATGPNRQDQGVLKETDVSITDDDSCAETYDAVGKTVFNDQHICAEAESACFDDEGSALICNGQLVGLVSWNLINCGGFPVVHTRAFNYLSWLSKNGCPLCSENVQKHNNIGSDERSNKNAAYHQPSISINELM